MPLRFLLLCLFFLVFSFVAAAQDETSDDDPIKVDTNLVVLNVVVTDAKGNHVPNLTAKDFKVFEDGVEQDITSEAAVFGAESTPFAAVILLDTSGSMEGRISLARSAAIKFLEGLRSDDVASVYNFDSEIKQVQEFSSSRDLYDSAYNIKAKGMTLLNDAVVEAAKSLSERAERRRAIIVLSDGEDTISKASQEKALRAALAVNAVIYTVDMAAIDDAPRGGSITSGGTNPRMAKMRRIDALKTFAEKSGGRFVPVSGGQGLRDAFKQIVDELSVQYTIGYEPKNTAADGKWRAIDVKTARPNIQVRSRKGYHARKEPKK